jgi:hypothetical protein
MRRREVILLVGGAATWPIAVRAQAMRVYRVGYLGTGNPRINPAKAKPSYGNR